MSSRNKKVPTAREFSSGGVVFKRQDKNVLWLIRRTVANDLYSEGYWMLPKGWIDDAAGAKPGPMASGKVRADEKSLQKAALREVEEEGGIRTKILNKVGTIKYSFKHPLRGSILKFVTFYVMEWEKDLPDGFGAETSEIKWLPFEKAYKTLSFYGEKQVLKKAQSLLPL